MTIINVSLLAIAVVLIFSEGWIQDFHQWVSAKVAEQ